MLRTAFVSGAAGGRIEHRFDSLGYINPVVRTPHLDRLPAECVVFTRAYSTSPSCVPARAAIYRTLPLAVRRAHQ